MVLQSLHSFGADYGAFDGAPQRIPADAPDAAAIMEEADKSTGGSNAVAKLHAHEAKSPESQAPPHTLYFHLSVRPLLAGSVRDKLPPRVRAALEMSGAKTTPGAEVEIFNAPGESPDST